MRILFLTRIMQRKALKKITGVHHGKYVPLKSARTVGFIVSAETPGIKEAVSKLKTVFAKMGLQYKGLCINLGKEPADEAVFVSDPMISVIKRRNLNWYGMPQKGTAGPFFGQNFDIVIDLTSGKRSFLKDFILKSICTSLLIGTDTYPDAPYDITVRRNEECTSASELTDNIIKYLTTIN